MMIRRGRRPLAALNRPFAPNRVAVFKTGKNENGLTQIAPTTVSFEPVAGKAFLHLCSNGACTLSPPDVEAMVEPLITV